MNSTDANTAPNLLTTREAAAYLRTSRRTLEGYRIRGGGPRYVKLPLKVLYAREDLDEYLSQRKVFSTSQQVGHA